MRAGCAHIERPIERQYADRDDPCEAKDEADDLLDRGRWLALHVEKVEDAGEEGGDGAEDQGESSLTDAERMELDRREHDDERRDH